MARRPGIVPALALGLAAAALAAGGAAWMLATRPAPAPPIAIALRPAAAPPSIAAPRAPAEPAVPPPARAVAARAPGNPPVLAADTLFGGRPVAWWQGRLEQLSERTDDGGRRVDLATRRVLAAYGLVVVERAGRLTLEPGDDLARELREGARP